MTVKIIKDFDGKFIDKLKKLASGKGERAVLVGVPASVTENDGTPMALVAAVHEYGVPEKGIPERSFIRTALQKNLARYKALNRANLAKVVAGKLSVEQALGQLGMMAKADIQDNIRSGTFAPLKQATIDSKGSSKPLIDTGNLRQSINYELEK